MQEQINCQHGHSSHVICYSWTISVQAQKLQFCALRMYAADMRMDQAGKHGWERTKLARLQAPPPSAYAIVELLDEPC